MVQFEVRKKQEKAYRYFHRSNFRNGQSELLCKPFRPSELASFADLQKTKPLPILDK